MGDKMEKKYKEMTANAKLSPQVLIGELIRRMQINQTQKAPGTLIKIKPNEMKIK